MAIWLRMGRGCSPLGLSISLIQLQMIKPEVTAVGRLLKAKPGQKHVYKVIAVNAEGQVRTIINRPAQ